MPQQSRPTMPVALLSAVLWIAPCIAQDTLPPQDGWTEIRAQGTPVRIFRDGFGVPHVYARTTEALFFGFGYATAQDRLAQLEFYRRAARGELAEIFGASADHAAMAGSIVDDIKAPVLEADYTIRRMTYTEEERLEQIGRLSDETQRLLRAYAEGANRWMDEARADARKMPAELMELGIEPRPWRPTDSMAVFHAALHRFGLFGGKELRNVELLKKLGADEFNRQYPLNNPKSVTTIAGLAPPGGRRACLDRPLYDRVGLGAGERTRRRERNLLRVFERVGFPAKYGSFVALIGPRRSASGRTVFLCCPQMKFYRPAIVHEVALHGGGFDVAGMAFPGVPAVILGRNRTVVWGLTSGHADNVDTFVEELDPANPRRYRFKGQWRELASREETFRVKGAAPQRRAILRSVHGPIIAEDKARGLAYAYQYTFWMKEYTTLEAFLDLARCTSLEQFRAACRKVSLSFNFFYSDVEGRIAFQFCGLYRVPAEGADVRLPVSGTGAMEWRGMVPFEDLPYRVDPPKGYFANWNNKPGPDWDNGDNLPWTGYNSVYWITDVIEDHPKMTFDAVRAIPRLIDTHGSYEQIVELSLPAFRAENILPPGQCGFLGPGGRPQRHATDQQPLADRWELKTWLWAPSADAWGR